MTTNDVALLREALTILRTYGWCQDSLNNEHGWVCAAGALAVATDEEMPYWFEYDGHVTNGDAEHALTADRVRLQALLGRAAVDLFPERAKTEVANGEFVTPYCGELVAFNDHPETEIEDVVAVYEHAIRRLELTQATS